MKYFLLLLVLLLVSCKVSQNGASPTQAGSTASIESFTSNMDAFDGFFKFYWSRSEDKIYLQIDKLNSEFLYVNSLAAGIGSNDIGLDRGQLGATRVVKFERHGQKILLLQPNYSYRADSDNQNEVESVREAFAQSVIWGFEVKAETEETVLIDASDFLLRDAHGVSDRLSGTKQGTFQVDKSRSAFYRENTINFPKNTEFESIITFKGKATGGYIRSVTPTSDAITVRMHHSFIELPDSQYQPREFDPRAGFWYVSYQDYATPIDQPLTQRYIGRHRLEKKNPDEAISEAVEPIVYYLDPGAPEPVRSALLDGARWWNEAFEAAGFRNAFQVKMLPDSAHPLDVRYNVIQWVHRSTRGWSYGATVTDPRTGEIIKGHVSLGSLRVRQDFLIAQGLLNMYEEGDSPIRQMALARIRQLSAHEVGHTIGLAHNFAASVNKRASVMDYPHPLVELDENGNITLSDAYDTLIGEWDKVAVRYGYSQGKSADELRQILEEAFQNGLLYITDRDARATDGAHSMAHLWDNGVNADEELARVLAIRKKALSKLSESSLREGQPYSELEEVLVPIYLFHRYQVEAAVKVIGGLNYNYAVKGGPQPVTSYVPAEQQLNALDALLSCLAPETLQLSETLLAKIPPKAFGYSRSRETFESKTGPVWDYYGAVETAAQLPLSLLLMPARANRLVMQHDRNPEQPDFTEILRKLIDRTWKNSSSEKSERAIQRIVEWKVLHSLMKLALDEKSRGDVRAITMQSIKNIRDFSKAKSGASYEDKAHYQLVVDVITSWLEEPEDINLPSPVRYPDGSPIGTSTYDFSCYD